MESLKEKLKLLMAKKHLIGDIYIEKRTKTEIMANEGEIEKLTKSESFGACIRVFKNGRMGFSYFTVKGPKEAEKMLDDAVAYTKAEGYENYKLPGKAEVQNIKLADQAFFDIKTEDKKKAILELEKSAGTNPKVKFVRDTTYMDQYSKISYFNTSGVDVDYEKSYYYFYVSAVAVDKNTQEVIDAGEGNVLFDRINITGLGRDCSDRAAGLLNGVSLKSGIYDLILPPYVAIDFVALLSRIFLGNNIRKGKSLLASNKKGDTIGPDILTIRDDALLEYSAGSYPVDAEGSAAKNKAVVEHGKLDSFLYDIINAAHFKAASTGNSMRADFKSLPDCGPSNFYIQAGSGSPAGESGILVNSMMGLHMTDTISGNFSLGINGWLIKNGEKMHPVKETLITGNIKDLLMKINKVYGDLKFYGNFGSPTIKVKDIQAAGK